MNIPLETLHVTVTYHDGQAEEDNGQPYFVAICDALNIVTEGQTLDETLKNLREALALALDEDDPIAVYNVVPHPRVKIVPAL